MSEMNPYQPPESAVEGVLPSQSSNGVKRHTELMVQHLTATRPWVLFLAVLGFIGAGFIVLAMLGAIVAAVAMPSDAGTPMVLVSLIYIPIAVIYVILPLQLIKYASAINRLASFDQTSDLEEALRCQKTFWRSIGICIIVMVALGIIGMIIAFAFGISQSLNTGAL